MNTRNRLLATSILLLASSAPVLADNTSAHGWDNRIGLLLGQKTYSEDSWKPHDEHGAIGLQMDFRLGSQPFTIAIDLFGLGQEHNKGAEKDETLMAEAHLGGRYFPRFSALGRAFSPYVGAGIALVSAEETRFVSGRHQTTDDTGTGFWLGTGITYDLGERMYLGADLRYACAEVELSDETRKTGGVMTSLGLGVQW